MSKSKESIRVCFMSSERENLSQITVGEPTLASVSPNNSLFRSQGDDV